MTTAAVMELAADLIRMGVDVQDINRQLYQEKPWVKMQLMREALNGMKLTPDGRICTFCLTNEAKARIGSRPEDTEGLIDLLRSVQGVWLAAYLEETEDDPRIRISLRSKTPEISVAELASRFGGGGHSMAAGVRIRGPIEEVRLTILKAMREEVERVIRQKNFMNVSDSIQVPSGVLLIDKARDMTSHDVVAIARRSLGIKKIGHCGTLDPMATGLLMLVVGKATKLQDKLMCEHKEYAGTLMLGVETSSQDAMGEIVAEYSVDGVTEQAVREAFDRFDGAFEQIPPMVSAIKKDGVPLYKLARKGQEIVREPRPVEVFGHGISRVAIPEVDFTVQCSKGFYVRSYAYDIGKALGCGAHLSALRRTRSGSFTLDRAITVDTLKTAPREELFRAMLSLKELADILIVG